MPFLVEVPYQEEISPLSQVLRGLPVLMKGVRETREGVQKQKLALYNSIITNMSTMSLDSRKKVEESPYFIKLASEVGRSPTIPISSDTQIREKEMELAEVTRKREDAKNQIAMIEKSYPDWRNNLDLITQMNNLYKEVGLGEFYKRPVLIPTKEEIEGKEQFVTEERILPPSDRENAIKKKNEIDAKLANMTDLTEINAILNSQNYRKLVEESGQLPFSPKTLTREEKLAGIAKTKAETKKLETKDDTDNYSIHTVGGGLYRFNKANPDVIKTLVEPELNIEIKEVIDDKGNTYYVGINKDTGEEKWRKTESSLLAKVTKEEAITKAKEGTKMSKEETYKEVNAIKTKYPTADINISKDGEVSFSIQGKPSYTELQDKARIFTTASIPPTMSPYSKEARDLWRSTYAKTLAGYLENQGLVEEADILRKISSYSDRASAIKAFDAVKKRFIATGHQSFINSNIDIIFPE